MKAWAAAIILLAPAPALGQIVSEGPESVAIVVYPDGDVRNMSNLYQGLVMVTERRTVDLPAGPSRVSFRGVAEGIVAQTVAVQGLPGGVKEQNFDYQLLSPGSLIANSEGRTVSVVRTNKATGETVEERARVVSSQNGALLDFNGRVEALRCSALPEKIVFNDLPPGYSDKPTLSVEVVSPRASRAVLTVSYLATGVAWAADYVARINPDGKTLDLSSWITIANRSATSFPDAPVQVLAGTLERQRGETRPIVPPQRFFNPNCWQINSGRYRAEVDEIVLSGGFVARSAPPPPSSPMPAPAMRAEMAAAPMEVVPEDLGDYKLYSLPDRTTVAAFQTKQLQMFSRPGVAFDRVHRFSLQSRYGRAAEGPSPALIIAELKNTKAQGLGLPLPAGIVSIFEPAGGGKRRFAGEDRVKDTAEGLDFEIDLGASVQVQAAVRIISNKVANDGQSGRTEVEVTISNARNLAVTVQVREANADGRVKVDAQSAPHAMKDGAPQWSIDLPANGSQVLTYALEWKA